MKIQFSVVIPVRNLHSRLIKVIPAWTKIAEENPDFEFCLGDDASDDGSGAVLNSLQKLPNFKVFLSPTHLGRGALRNQLCNLATSDRIIFLDGDCFPDPTEWPKAWRKIISSRPHAAFVGKVSYENANISRFARYLTQASGPERLNHDEALDCAYFTTGNSSIPKALWQKANGFRLDFHGWGGEDYDLGLRLSQLGLPLYFAPGTDVQHPPIMSPRDYFLRMESFGRGNLRILARENPTKPELFHLDKLQLWPIRFVLLPILSPIFRKLLEQFDRLPWPNIVYRATIFSAYAKAFIKTRQVAREAK